jgi:hypothetical protein
VLELRRNSAPWRPMPGASSPIRRAVPDPRRRRPCAPCRSRRSRPRCRRT